MKPSPAVGLPDLRHPAAQKKENWFKRRWHERTGRSYRYLSFESRCKHRRTYWAEGGKTCERCGVEGLMTVWL